MNKQQLTASPDISQYLPSPHHQLNRILTSNLNSELIVSLQQNEHQLQYLQQILETKNQQVSQLHHLINQQLNKTIQENLVLKKCIASVSLTTKHLKQQSNTFKKITQDMQKLMMSSFTQILLQIQKDKEREIEREKTREREREKLQKNEKKTDRCRQIGSIVGQRKIGTQIGIQTEPCQIEPSLNSHLFERLQQLQKTVLMLKQQKWQLQKSLQKYNMESPESSRSSISLAQNQSFSILSEALQSNFSVLTQHRYQGQLVNNKKYGIGVCQYNRNFTYEGSFVNGLRHGVGQMRYEGEVVYRGEWVKDCIMGKGCLWQGSFRLIGRFVGPRLEGIGTVVREDGTRVRAHFKDGVLFGDVLVEDQEGNVIQYGEAGADHNLNISLQAILQMAH